MSPARRSSTELEAWYCFEVTAVSATPPRMPTSRQDERPPRAAQRLQQRAKIELLTFYQLGHPPVRSRLALTR